jgi:hypothetical protein
MTGDEELSAREWWEARLDGLWWDAVEALGEDEARELFEAYPPRPLKPPPKRKRGERGRGRNLDPKPSPEAVRKRCQRNRALVKAIIEKL